MLAVLPGIRIRYAEFLAREDIAQKYISICQKYLRYYLDFCQRYQHESTTAQSLEAFLHKLSGEKKM